MVSNGKSISTICKWKVTRSDPIVDARTKLFKIQNRSAICRIFWHFFGRKSDIFIFLSGIFEFVSGDIIMLTKWFRCYPISYLALMKVPGYLRIEGIHCTIVASYECPEFTSSLNILSPTTRRMNVIKNCENTLSGGSTWWLDMAYTPRWLSKE